jgi:hypothetical protein
LAIGVVLVLEAFFFFVFFLCVFLAVFAAGAAEDVWAKTTPEAVPKNKTDKMTTKNFFIIDSFFEIDGIGARP